MGDYEEFQYFLAEHVSSDGLPDPLAAWSAADLRKLIEMAEAEITRRTS